MKSFKQYLTEVKNRVEQGIMVNGVPAAVILNDRGIYPNQAVDPTIKQGVVINGVPAALVMHNHKSGLKEDAVSGKVSWGWKNDNHHLGAHVDDVENSMHNLHQHSPESMDHLHRYTEGSTTLNKTLYKHHVEGSHPPGIVRDPFVGGKEHDVEGLDKAVEHHTLPHDLHVYSGTHFNPGILASNHDHGHIHLPAYTSTTIDKVGAEHFAHSASYDKPALRDGVGGEKQVHGHILHVHLKAGDKGAYIGKHSSYQGEKEFLLPRNTRLKVHPTPTMHHNNGNGHTYAVWHAETVKQD